ncbi:hypothetical protein [Bacillus sp. ISL-75]|uniref:hypothetical protein n=1 Tax=Bacillus sp. ISL-75 TaxID=2819137 RepID=UPI002034FCC9|nr:hypothetical protein [Bacillus sp. ISL-75]
MELLEQLEIVDVRFEENNQKAEIVFLDDMKGEIREVYFNRLVFDKENNKWVPDEKKALQVDQWCEEYFQLPFDRLGEAIGEKKDVYCYDFFNSLWEVQIVEKFNEDMEGQIFETEIVKAVDDGKKISLQFEYEGKLYESKMQYADYLEARKEWFINPVKRKKQYDKFSEKFNMPVEEIENMVGKTVLVEVKKAMGKYIYSEIKPFKKVKK